MKTTVKTAGFVFGLAAFLMGSWLVLADNAEASSKRWQYSERSNSQVGETEHVESDQDILKEIAHLENLKMSDTEIADLIQKMYGETVCAK